MASGKITNKNTLSGAISSGNNLKTAAIAGGSGTTDHSRLINRAEPSQHPIEAITGLREELEAKLNSETAMPLIQDALKNKACGLYFDAKKELARKAYWYLTAEIDETTKMGKLGPNKTYLSGPYDLGMGGGSGAAGVIGGGVTTVTVTPVNWPTAVVIGNDQVKTNLTIKWDSKKDDTPITETGTVYVLINDKQVEVLAGKAPGEVVIEDITRHSAFIAADNKVEVRVMDIYGTIRNIVKTIKGITLSLKSDFVAKGTIFLNGDVDYTYTPVGDAAKVMYFELDGNTEDPDTISTSVSNTQGPTYRLRGLSHGSHTLKVYFKADVGGNIITSNSYFYDLICVDPNNSQPIIASDFEKFDYIQYSSFKIPYYVYANGNKVTLPVTLKVDGEVYTTLQATIGKEMEWSYRADAEGIHTLEILCGTATPKVFTITVAKSDIKVLPESEGQVLALSAHNRNNANSAARETWEYVSTEGDGATYKCKLANFNWSSNGWIYKEADKTSVLRVSNGASVSIPLQPFSKALAEGPKGIPRAGRTIEVDFSTSNIHNYDTPIFACLDKVYSPFFEVEEVFVNADDRLYGYAVEYDYDQLSKRADLVPDKTYEFKYQNGSWTEKTTDGTYTTVNLANYYITLTEKMLSASGKDLGRTPLEGDQILLKYSLKRRGIEITPKAAAIRSQQSYLAASYKEDEHIRVAFVIEPTPAATEQPSAGKNQVIWIYINGVASAAVQYPSADKFIQLEPTEILIGSTEAIIDIYNIRVYNQALTSKQVVDNWIADTADVALKATRYRHNDVLNQNGEVVANMLPTDLPYMIWGIDRLPTSKNDVRTDGTTARFIDPSNSARNFTAYDGEYKVQGTSSAIYPVKNIRLRLKKGKGGPNLEWFDDDGNDLIIKNGGKGFPITYPDGIGVDYFTFKVDYASSEGANNVELVKLYNDASKKYGLLTPPQITQPEGSTVTPDQIRVGIDGFPIVVFYQAPGASPVFHTKANFNNDKDNEDVYGFIAGDESWETTNNSSDVGKYKEAVDKESGNFSNGFEARYPKDSTNVDRLAEMTAWVCSTRQDTATGLPLDSSVTFTYTKSTQVEDGGIITTEVTEEFTHDTKEYRLAKFKTELKDWFNVDSCLFYYLFTELFLMIDSRAKNAFPTYFTTRTNTLVVDDDGNKIPNTYTDGGNRWFWIPYDMDTAIGIDNKGKLVFDYNLEDIDTIEGGAAVYNGQDSVMWCNIRDAFRGELADMYIRLRNQALIDYNEVERRFEEHQHKWPEVILNIDAQNKYIAPLPGADYLAMLQGNKEQQRKWWLYNRFKYMDSKYTGGDATADRIAFRTYIKAGQPKPDIKVIPYASIYASASFANGYPLVSERAKVRDVEVVLKNPFKTEEIYTDQEVSIYSASQLKSVGDLSGFYLDTLDISKATRLQELKVGDASADYSNPYLKTLAVGANTLLRKIDARNCKNLGATGAGTTPAPNLSGCISLEEAYFTGTKITGLRLPDGGTLKKLHLPGTMLSLKLQNQPALEELVLKTISSITKNINDTPVGYSFTGKVVTKNAWNELSTNADLYLSDDSLDGFIVRVNIADKGIYDSITEGTSILTVNCNYLAAHFELVSDPDPLNPDKLIETVTLAEYSTREVTGLTLVESEDQINIGNVFEQLSVTAPKVLDFKTTNLEELWLEGIPSNAIKAKDFVQIMKEGTAVCLLGINETYDSYEDIIEFYNDLDKHCGVDITNSGIQSEKPQVQGIINVDSIPYKQYIELTARYPDVVINAKQIICTIQFYNKGHYEHGQYVGGKLYKYVKVALKTSLDSANKLVIAGKTVFAPLNPTKEPTQSHYYEFDKWLAQPAIYSTESGWGYPVVENEEEIPTWTEDYLIFSDMRIDATYLDYLQEYTVVFDTDSDKIFIDEAHRNLVVEYGSTLSRPQLLNVPQFVSLAGWYPTEDYSGYPWVFNDDGSIEPVNQVLGPVTLKAKWDDGTAPTISIRRLSYNTFNFEVRDNLGITGWAVVKDSVDAPTSWNTVKSTTYISDAYEIDSAGEYYFWISDISGNTATQKVTAYSINVNILESDGHTPVHKYSFIEGENTFRTNFALADTILKFVLDEDPHYKDLSVEIDAALADSLDTFIVAQDVAITIGCTPKDYTVTFVTGKEFDGVRVASQTITYRHKPEKPLALYHAGYIINAWYTDNALTTLWNFETDVIEGNISLYAEWWEYRTPTRIKVKIPHNFDEWEDGPATSDANYESIRDSYNPYRVCINYSQNRANSVKVTFGDGSEEFSTEATGHTTIEHIYTEPGEYIIEIYGTAYGYRLGEGYSTQTVDPGCCVTDIEFAWDITTTAPFAFKGAQIEELNLTPYMTTIATGAFAVCRKLKTLKIPKSIQIIEAQAFENCEGLTGNVTIPKTVSTLGSSAFRHCHSLNQLIFEENGQLTFIEPYLANDSGITYLRIPGHITKIGDGAFGNCNKLQKVVLMNPNLAMGANVFANIVTNLSVAGPIDWSLGAGNNDKYNIEYAWVERIPENAFSSPTNPLIIQSALESIILPDGVKEIGDNAFQGTFRLTSISLPNSLETIGARAFYSTGLTKLIVPNSVSNIGACAFGFNSNLADSAVTLYCSSSTTLVAYPQDGWFFGCASTLKPKIPAHLIEWQGPDENIVQNLWIQYYGPHWNAYAYNQDTGFIGTLEFEGINKETE